MLKSGKPKEQLLQDHIWHSLSHDAVFAYPEKLQLILPPASNDILENSNSVVIPPPPHTNLQQSEETEAMTCITLHERPQTKKTDFSFHVINDIYNNGIYTKKYFINSVIKSKI